MSQIYTIGYEGSDFERFIETLSILGIEVVADVRQLPISRKRGFSKNRLAEGLQAHGISYRHFKDLGDPKAGREAARSGHYEAFRTIFLNHFYTDEAQSSLNQLIELARTYRTCILCFERCAARCHRSIIADAAVMRGMDVFNLVADRPERYVGNEENLPRHYPRQSLSAAE